MGKMMLVAKMGRFQSQREREENAEEAEKREM